MDKCQNGQTLLKGTVFQTHTFENFIKNKKFPFFHLWVWKVQKKIIWLDVWYFSPIVIVDVLFYDIEVESSKLLLSISYLYVLQNSCTLYLSTKSSVSICAANLVNWRWRKHYIITKEIEEFEMRQSEISTFENSTNFNSTIC